MRQELKELLDKTVQQARALAADADWPRQAYVESGEEVGPDWNCPSIPRIAVALREGFTDEEERSAIGNPQFQRMVNMFWNMEPASFWMLARYLADGDKFPFAQAMRHHLENSDAGRQSRLALDFGFTRRLAIVIEKTRDARDAGLRLRDRILAWEAKSRRFMTEFPAPVGAFADKKIEPFDHGEEFADGLTVHLEEVVTSNLHVAISRPARIMEPDTLHVSLIGEASEPWRAEVSLDSSGEFSGGRADAGDFSDIRHSVGTRCLVVISPEPLPDLEE